MADNIANQIITAIRRRQVVNGTIPENLLNQICAVLGLFDGARPVSPGYVVTSEILPAIEALKANNPEAGILVRENQRVNELWRDALARMAEANRNADEANRRADGFLKRYNECEGERQSLLLALRGK